MAIKYISNLVSLSIILLVSCTSTKQISKPSPAAISKLVLLDEFDIPFNQTFNNTTIGGLSGIDYNAAKDEYYLVCDDRSAINPARFYTAKITINNNQIDTVLFTAVTSLLQSNGQVYPSTKQDPFHTPDPESIRFNKSDGSLVWSSEGERTVTAKEVVLEDPAITAVTSTGKYIDTFTLPPQLKMSAAEKGPRQNGVLEGLTFSQDFKYLYASVEEPLYEDGLPASVDQGAFIRIIKFDVAARKPIGQFAYKLEPVAHASTPDSAFKINGVTEILSSGPDKLLVLERSFSTGNQACTIKVFEADLANASDVSNNYSMQKTPPQNPIKKRLLLNMDDLGIYIDNVEGLTYGPLLANGHKTIVFIADNNFLPTQKTQVFLFELLP